MEIRLLRVVAFGRKVVAVVRTYSDNEGNKCADVLGKFEVLRELDKESNETEFVPGQTFIHRE